MYRCMYVPEVYHFVGFRLKRQELRMKPVYIHICICIYVHVTFDGF